MKRTIFYLIGPRSSGKSSLLTFFADDRDLVCSDLDSLLEVQFGCSISDYVAAHGWDAFRDAESGILRAVSEENTDQIRLVATGGGIVLRHENREYMRKTGRSIYLDVPKEILLARYLSDPKQSQRPALTGLQIEDEIEKILQERTPLYTETADARIAGTCSPEEAAQRLRSLIREFLQKKTDD